MNSIKTYSAKSIRSINPINAYKVCQKSAILVDLRMPYLTAFKKFKLRNILLLPFNTLASNIPTIPKNKLIILADTANTKSTDAYFLLIAKGFEKVAVLSGGFLEWESDGLPVITDNKKQLSGSCVCQLKTRN